MTEAPETSETPSGHLRWVRHYKKVGPTLTMLSEPVLQQQFYLTTYRGTEVDQTTEWRDVPVVIEE